MVGCRRCNPDGEEKLIFREFPENAGWFRGRVPLRSCAAGALGRARMEGWIMQLQRAWVAVIGIACGIAPGALGDVITVFPSKDNSLFEDPSGNLSGGVSSAIFLGRLGGNGN